MTYYAGSQDSNASFHEEMCSKEKQPFPILVFPYSFSIHLDLPAAV